MKRIITYPTAFTYWMSCPSVGEYVTAEEILGADALSNSPSGGISDSADLPCRPLEGITDSADLEIRFLEGISDSDVLSNLPFEKPVHFMVMEAKSRRADPKIQWHIVPKYLPDHSFIRLSEFLYIISPELCFLLAGNDLTLPELVMAGDDLCGTFFVDTAEHHTLQNGEPLAGSQMTNMQKVDTVLKTREPLAGSLMTNMQKVDTVLKAREPLTSLSKIQDYLNNASGLKGVKKARMAAQYILERSNSPKETEVAAASMLPLNQGGYSLLAPGLNYNVPLAEEAKNLMKRESLCCDIVWPEQKIVVEYDSEQYHILKDQFVYDKRKATALNLSGYKVFNITKDNLRNFAEVETFFLSLRKALGIRMHADRLKKYEEKRKQTVKEIFLTKRRMY